MTQDRMNQERTIHDVLDSAVRDHSPRTIDPARAVLDRQRRQRRRSILLTAAVTSAVVLGGAVALDAVDTQTRGAPAAGPGRPPVVWPSGQPQDALGREEAARAAEAETRAEAERLAVAEGALLAANAAQVAGTFTVTPTAAAAVVVPPGWLPFTAPSSAAPGDVICSSRPNIVYAVTVTVGDQPAAPCLGAPVAPYLWAGALRLPAAEALVSQELLADGRPRWIQTGIDNSGGPTIDVSYPTTGQSVRAVGLGLDDVTAVLRPPRASPATPLLPADTTGLRLRLGTGEGDLRDVPPDDGQALLDLLRVQPALPPGSRGSCAGAATPADPESRGPRPAIAHWQLELRRADRVVGVLVVDAAVDASGGGCGIAASTFGAVVQVDADVLAQLTRASG